MVFVGRCRRYAGEGDVNPWTAIEHSDGKWAEFISKDLDLWAWGRGITLDISRPGKPTDKAFIESFNAKVRAECIDQNWFLTLDDSRSKCEAYQREKNEDQPYSSIGKNIPMEFINSISQLRRLLA